MSKLNDQLKIKSVTIRNRIGMSPMCQYSAVDGFANDWHFVHYGTRAVGGVGLIVVEATAVSPEGRITPYDLGLWSDEQIAPLKKISDFIHNFGAVSAIQLAHAGRKASHDSPVNGGKQLNEMNGGWQILGPSAIAFDPSEIAPIEMTKEDINQVVNQFAEAAIRADKADFDIIEIHGAHGYLIHEFLSPLSNKRTDEYGGIFENRIRFLSKIVESIQRVWPTEKPLFVRLSCTDWAEGGWNIDETVKLCSILKEKGVDLIDCSSGGNSIDQKIKLGPGYQVPFSEAIKKTGIQTAAVGMITSMEQINSILEEEKADMVFLARELLRNPYFNLKTEDSIWPIQYLRAK
jgi:2,4-dienoyl-CoA reductase-like NADH-dependent reductase (Old Yellow Enzyme family)